MAKVGTSTKHETMKFHNEHETDFRLSNSLSFYIVLRFRPSR